MFGLAGSRLYAAIAGAVCVALFLGWVWRIDSLRAQHKRDYAACQANFAQFQADVEAKTELARISDLAHKNDVERQQTQIQSEKNDAIRNAIAAARATAGRVQPAAKAHSSGSTATAVSSPPSTPGSADGAGETSELASDRMICAENTVKAEGWQSWAKSVAAIPR